jgi:hypothetical protein
LVDDKKALSRLLLNFEFGAGGRFFNFNVVFVGQPTKRFYITVFLQVHQKADAVAAFATAKTLVNFFGGGYGKRGRFFIVKRA